MTFDTTVGNATVPMEIAGLRLGGESRPDVVATGAGPRSVGVHGLVGPSRSVVSFSRFRQQKGRRFW